MKTKTLLLLFLFISGIMSAQVKRVAILEAVDKENKVSYANKLILRTSLSKAIVNVAGCEVYDRTDIDAIMSEHTFQRTGLVSSDQIKKLGEMTGADYILVAEAVKVNAKKIFVTAKLLDVETARTIVTEMLEINIDHMQQGCTILAKKMFSDKKEIDFGAQIPMGPKLVRNSKADQLLFGLGAYSYGETQLDKKAYETFLRENSPEAYKKYIRGKNSIIAGWTFFTVGLLTSAAGGACFALAESAYDKYMEFVDVQPDFYVNHDGNRYEQINPNQNYSRSVLNAMPIEVRAWYEGANYYFNQHGLSKNLGISLLSVGGSLTVVSIPLLGAGYGTRDNAYKKYNEVQKKEKTLTLNLQSSQSGIGLALSF